MIKESHRFYLVMSELYSASLYARSREYSFDHIMKDNNSRMQFIELLFEEYKNHYTTFKGRQLFDENIDFLMDFISSPVEEQPEIPQYIYDDLNDYCIIPSDKEIDDLINLIKANYKMYVDFYKDVEFKFVLPDNTFNQNMVRNLTVEEKNLPHLMGLRDSEQKNKQDDNNHLFELFMSLVPEEDKKSMIPSQEFIRWVVSSNGEKVIRKTNKMLQAFRDKDRLIHPETYDKNGNIVKEHRKEFYARINEECKNLNFKFPLIKYGRCYVKCFDNLHFLNMDHINQVILDYNSKLKPKDPDNPDQSIEDRKIKKFEKDIFIVSASPKRLNQLTKKYLRIINRLRNIISKAKYSDDIRDKVIDLLQKYGLKRDLFHINELLNIVDNEEYYSKNGIVPHNVEYKDATEKIMRFIESKFNPEVFFIGFGTDYQKDKDNQMVETPLDDHVTYNSHCDTSVSANIAELISDYYVRGRCFFIDKIEGNNGIYRLSTPNEEIAYLSQMERLNEPVSNDKKVILKELKKCNKLYLKYKVSRILDSKNIYSLIEKYTMKEIEEIMANYIIDSRKFKEYMDFDTYVEEYIHKHKK